MATNKKQRIARALLQAAEELLRRRLWERLGNDACILLRVPSEEHPVMASIMGQAGEEFGLTLFRDEHCLSHTIQMTSATTIDEELLDEVSIAGFSRTPLRDIPPEHRGLFQQAGIQALRDHLLPYFLVKRPHQMAREPRPTEIQTLLYATLAILRVDDAHELHPPSLRDAGPILVADVTGNVLRPNVAWRLEAIPEVAHDDSQLLLPPIDSDLPRGDHSWIVGVLLLPQRVEGEEGTLRAVVILEQPSGRCALVEPILGGTTQDICQVVLDALGGRHQGSGNGLPARVIFTSPALHRHLEPLLEQASVECLLDPVHPDMEEFRAGLFNKFSLDTQAPDEPPPAPDDLEGWKRADGEVFTRMLVEAEESGRESQRSLGRYFGSADVAEELQEELEDSFFRMTFLQWLFTDYRPTRRSSTLLELRLKKEISDTERMLLEARRDHGCRIVRVDSIGEQGAVHVMDLLSGERLIGTDFGLAGSIQPNTIVMLRLVPAGNYLFVDCLGPPLPPAAFDRAMLFLEKIGLEVSPKGLRENSHLLGRLWDWWRVHVLDAPDPVLANTDGDEFVWHTAEFHCRDEIAAEKALRATKGVDEAEEDGQYVWLSPENTLLARLHLLPGSLVVEVNSEERLGRAREWLEKIPGVRFSSVQRKRVQDPSPPPLDDRLNRPAPITELPPELTAQLESMLHERLMGWIDEPIPALGGRTPRETCKTAEGRRKVATMIRSMPRPAPQAPQIDVPREAMLRELGIDSNEAGV